MNRRRRNTLTRLDAQIVAAVAVLSGLLAALAGCEPTGEPLADAALCFGFAAFVTWAGATAPWWALVVASGAAAAFAWGSPWLLVLGLLAVGGAVYVALGRAGNAVVRAAVAGVVAQVVLRLEWDPFFLSSALAATAIAGLVAVSGLLRRYLYVRVRVQRGVVVLAAIAGLALVGLAVSGLLARSSATAGYQKLLDGLRLLQNGDPPEAAEALREASLLLRNAGDDLNQPWAQPARAVPVLAQHRSGLSAVVTEAADAADAAASTLDFVDLDQLRVVNGVIDVEALSLLAAPLGELERTVTDLQAALDEADSPWLLWPFQNRIEQAQQRVSEVARQAEATSAAAQVGPAMLGMDGPRRYFVAFTSPAEARGQSGLMGNWVELTVDRGRLEVTDDGRTAELGNLPEGADPLRLDASEEFFARYGAYGAGDGQTPVNPKFWSNITMPPDTPTVGSAMAQLYEQATGRRVDGAFIVDPAAIAAFLEITGPVTLPTSGVVLSAGNAEQFLLRDQYERPEGEREDLLAEATDATVDQVLNSSLPGPQVLAAELGPVALGGHLSGWVGRPEEQRLLELVGMDSALPALGGRDGLAIVTNNGSGNKIDSFLERDVRYQPVFDPSTGELRGEVAVTLTNTAPTEGFPDYVIGNIIGAPTGTNRTLLSIYTPHTVTVSERNGRPVDVIRERELGWNVYTLQFDLASGERSTVRLELEGLVNPGGYELVVRPQPLAQPERLFAEVKAPDGRLLAGFAGNLDRRSVLSGDGLEAYRPD